MKKAAEISGGLLSDSKHLHAVMDIIPGGEKYANIGHML